MKKINVRFMADDSLDDIEIIIRAKECDAQVNQLIESIDKKNHVKLTALDKDGCPNMIAPAEIVFISVEGKRVNIITTSGNFRAKQSLQSIEALLGSSFLRVSRFEIIDLRMVQKYDFTFAGTLRIEFINGMATWASRRYIPLIKERITREEGYLC